MKDAITLNGKPIPDNYNAEVEDLLAVIRLRCNKSTDIPIKRLSGLMDGKRAAELQDLAPRIMRAM
jgi:hypothetical protein